VLGLFAHPRNRRRHALNPPTRHVPRVHGRWCCGGARRAAAATGRSDVAGAVRATRLRACSPRRPGSAAALHPDGGADTLRHRPAEVWQAKRYSSDGINWKECERSLDSSIERFKPSKVAFVFPRDLSQQLEQSFEDRLVKRASAQKARVQVGLWT
jgi:hypothetical protein